MTINEYKANIILHDIPFLEDKLSKVNDTILAFGLKSQGLSQQEFLDLKFNMIDNYDGTYQSAYQIRKRLVNQLTEKRLEALPAEKKYFIRVVNDPKGQYVVHTETFKCLEEINPNTVKVIRLDHYLEAKQDPENEDLVIENYAKFLRKKPDGIYRMSHNKNSIFFLSDSPTAFSDYRFQ